MNYIYAISQLGGTLQRLPPVGRCIYCRRLPSQAGKLTHEHIIPDGLGGDLLLEEASCKECSRIINKWESHFINEALGNLRAHLNLRSRKKRNRGGRYKNHTISIGKGEMSMHADLEKIDAHNDKPFVAFFPVCLERPRIFTGVPLQAPLNFTAKAIYPINIMDRSKKLQFAPKIYFRAMLSLPRCWKMIAKISHAFAVACLGIDGFKPFLNDLILSEKMEFDIYNMGCAETSMTFDGYHLIELSIERSIIFHKCSALRMIKTLAVVRFQLFSNFNTPCFEVVVGEV